MAPLHFALPRWRLLLLAAFVLLAGAMGGSDAAARAGIGGTRAGCLDQGSGDQRLTTKSQPALIQGALRHDGKSMAGGDSPALPGGAGLPARLLTIQPDDAVPTQTLPRKTARGPGQPRGPPANC